MVLVFTMDRIFGAMKGQNGLLAFDNSWYKPGGNFLSRALWYWCSSVFVNSRFPFSGCKKFLLRLFGARIGKGVVIKPNVNVKYPWNLEVGDFSWIRYKMPGLETLAPVKIGSNCCISQGGFLLTGNHDFSKLGIDLMVKPIVLEDGTWVGAKSIVCPGVTLKSHAVLAVVVATSDLDAWSIYQGNPAVKVRERQTKSE